MFFQVIGLAIIIIAVLIIFGPQALVSLGIITKGQMIKFYRKIGAITIDPEQEKKYLEITEKIKNL